MTALVLGRLRACVANRMRQVTGVRAFWLVLVAATVLFALVLMFEPTGAGRGGR